MCRNTTVICCNLLFHQRGGVCVPQVPDQVGVFVCVLYVCVCVPLVPSSSWGACVCTVCVCAVQIAALRSTQQDAVTNKRSFSEFHIT